MPAPSKPSKGLPESMGKGELSNAQGGRDRNHYAVRRPSEYLSGADIVKMHKDGVEVEMVEFTVVCES